MQPETYYVWAALTSIAATIFGAIMKWAIIPAYAFIKGVGQAIYEINIKIDLIMNNHLHDLKERIERIEEHLFGETGKTKGR